MEDLISRRAAMAYPLSWEHYDKEHGDRKFISGVESYREYIEHLPSADRPRGKWIDMGDFEQCSVCEGTHLKEFETRYGKALWVKSKYCPNCGADMRGGTE